MTRGEGNFCCKWSCATGHSIPSINFSIPRFPRTCAHPLGYVAVSAHIRHLRILPSSAEKKAAHILTDGTVENHDHHHSTRTRATGSIRSSESISSLACVGDQTSCSAGLVCIIASRLEKRSCLLRFEAQPQAVGVPISIHHAFRSKKFVAATLASPRR